ncbi:hypothetical protein [Arthrobacter sp. 4R501]|uniref:hypothetical protein n=1 Tax=Arthrobacter sp. 4R501 TaxID=2058886 RepID=UPI000CE42C27|nr:hypothetical protein [Arthrobacter sp. 4R501]
MSDPAPRPRLPDRVRHGREWPSPRVHRILAVVLTVAAAGSLVLVVVDLVIGRPAAGDVFIAILNSLAAAVLWWHSSEQARS